MCSGHRLMQFVDGICIIVLGSCGLQAACTLVVAVFDWKGQMMLA